MALECIAARNANALSNTYTMHNTISFPHTHSHLSFWCRTINAFLYLRLGSLRKWQCLRRSFRGRNQFEQL
jgi:hypothetical protein